MSSYEGFPYWEKSEQEVYDFVAAALLKQGAASISDEACSYRGDGGRMCAAGFLIADKDYDSNYEGRDWEMLCSVGAVSPAHSDLIIDLQGIHDSYHHLEWPRVLRNLAVERNLLALPTTEEMSS